MCAAVTLLGVMCCDPSGGTVATVVDLSGVEVAVSALRGFADVPAALLFIMDALASVCQSADGVVAVVSRGGTRQISRMLQDFAAGAGVAAGWGPSAPSVLERLLVVVDASAKNAEAAETLKKQGVVQVVVSVLDSPAVADTAGAQDAFGEVRRLITSILSRLLNMAEVGEACRAVLDTCSRMQAGVGEGAAGGLSRTALSVGIAGLNKLIALCEVPIGRNAGHAAWREGCKCVAPFRVCACERESVCV